MTRPCVLITRPKEDAEEWAKTLRTRGYKALIEPLLVIHPRPGAVTELQQALRGPVQAIITTSRYAQTLLPPSPPVPVFHVSDTTDGTAEGLVSFLTNTLSPENGPVLYLRGEDISFDLSAALARHNFTTQEIIAYHAAAVPTLSPALTTTLTQEHIHMAPFLSPRTLEHFLALTGQAQLTLHLRHIHCIALSERIAQAARSAVWKEVHVSPHPSLTSLMETMDIIRTCR